ncbi:MAG TPA: FAD-dependent oxidoreductase, partial [Kribbella sp.]|nr:FAD-dependent oxidoreductase [Kribbella sp.]
HAFALYSVADAERLRQHLQSTIHAGSAEPEDEGALDVVVVGGGPTGVEIAGALTELMTALAATERIAKPGTITVVDRGSTLLAAFSRKSHKYAHKRLTEHGADPRLGTGVSAVHADRVEFDDGSSIRTRTVIWGGGESAAAVVGNAAGVTTGRGGRIDVLPDLTVDGHPHVYAVGDVANIPAKDGTILPQLGSVAQQSGAWAAGNILRELHGEKAEPFRYKDKGIMAMIGRNAAVAEVGKHRHQVEGPVAFAAWLGVHAMLLSGAHSKTDAFLNWAWDYFDRDHAATVEWSAEAQRIAWGDESADVPHIRVGSARPADGN